MFFVRVYQLFVSPFLSRGACRYEPTCSEYMVLAVKKYGGFKGFVMGCRRIMSCHPFSKRDRVDYP